MRLYIVQIIVLTGDAKCCVSTVISGKIKKPARQVAYGL
jgi:hypothetical protein